MKRVSRIWQSTKEEFKQIVERSKTMEEILNNYGLKNKGTNYKTVYNRINYEGLIFTPEKHVKNKINRNKVLTKSKIIN